MLIEGATISFSDNIYYTDNSGTVTLSAPEIDQDTNLVITASKSGYRSESTTITVINEDDDTPMPDDEPQIGWIKGYVYEQSENISIPISNATVCLVNSQQDNVITSICTNTDGNGNYSIESTPGTYKIKAGKNGYNSKTIENIAILHNETTYLDIALEKGIMIDDDFFSVLLDEERQDINSAIEEGIVPGEVLFNKQEGIDIESTVVYYSDDIVISSIETTAEIISFLVSADDKTPAKTLIINLDTEIFDENKEAKIYSNNIRLNLLASDDEYMSAKTSKRSQGMTRKDARDNADLITYSYKLEDDELRLDGYFLSDIENKSAEQRVYVDLYLPEGQVVYLDNSTRTFLYDVDNTQNIYDNDMAKHYYIMTRDGLSCLDCEDHEINIGDETDSFNMKIDEGGVHIEIQEDSKEKTEVKIDKNGVLVKSAKDSI